MYQINNYLLFEEKIEISPCSRNGVKIKKSQYLFQVTFYALLIVAEVVVTYLSTVDIKAQNMSSLHLTEMLKVSWKERLDRNSIKNNISFAAVIRNSYVTL